MPKKKPVDTRSKLTQQAQDSICQALRVGCYMETAAAMAGVNASTLHVWLRRGAAEIRRREIYALDLEARMVKDRELRKHRSLSDREKKLRRQAIETNKTIKKREQKYVDFHMAVEKAMAQGEMHDLGIIANAARGGAVIERRITKDKQGKEVVIEKHSHPQWQAAAWKLERRNPKRWARVQRMEIKADGIEGGEESVQTTWAEAVKAAYKRRHEKGEKRLRDNDDTEEMHMLPESPDGARVPDEVITSTDVGEA